MARIVAVVERAQPIGVIARQNPTDRIRCARADRANLGSHRQVGDQAVTKKRP